MNRLKYLYLNSRDEFFRVDISKIVYFESDGNYTNIILSNRIKATLGMNLAQMQQILNENLRNSAAIFARVGKRHIINLNYVYHIAILKQKIVLSDGENFEYQLTMSKEALRTLREMYIQGLSSTSYEEDETAKIK